MAEENEFKEKDGYKPSAPVSCSTDPASLPEDVKRKILAARDAIIQEDFNEAYHQLYSIADPEFEKFDPWAALGGW